jgi:protein-tyrosine phosphatase
MIDLHCHILPGVDDGATSLAEALTMARLLTADGVTHVTATPHCNEAYPLFRPVVLPLAERFNDELRKADVPLVVLPGSEIQVTDTSDYLNDFEAGLLCHLGGGRRFTLMEFPWRERNYPSGAPELVAWLREQGVTPLVAHPERTPYLAADVDELGALAAAGAWFQVTVDSLLGRHGPAPRAAADEILRDFRDVVLATDAHHPGRCSGLAPGYTWVRARFGAAREADLRARSESIRAALLADLSGDGK